jgi:hypothetical protein
LEINRGTILWKNDSKHLTVNGGFTNSSEEMMTGELVTQFGKEEI